jgi:hypothetical protein
MDLKKILKNSNRDEVAAVLFPDNGHPVRALNRVISGKSYLNSKQLVTLADYLGITVGELYSANAWRSVATNKIITFYRGPYIARLNTSTWITQVFKKDDPLYEGVIHGANVPLSKYIFELNKICNYDTCKN